jgi:hypothetical protein
MLLKADRLRHVRMLLKGKRHLREPDKTESAISRSTAQALLKSQQERTHGNPGCAPRVATSEYHRKHAIALLRGHRGWRDSATPLRRLRKRIYNNEDKQAVLRVLEMFDHISSERLRAAMDVELATIRQQGHLEVSAGCYEHLQHISASSTQCTRTSPTPISALHVKLVPLNRSACRLRAAALRARPRIAAVGSPERASLSFS